MTDRDATRREYSDAELDAAVDALTDPERFREAESLVARPRRELQRILAQALEAGGWFAESTRPSCARRWRSTDDAERDDARCGPCSPRRRGWG